MIYSIFMRKTQGDTQPFPTTTIVNEYINRFVKNDDITIAFPGYMSTKEESIDLFIKSMDFRPKTFFTAGMNGSRNVETESIQNLHNKRFAIHIDGLTKTNFDHAKMMFFLQNTGSVNNDVISVKDLLSMQVKAALIGSSNQSFITYCSNKADKGEADILLIDGDYVDKNDSEAQRKISFFYETLDLDVREQRPRNYHNNEFLRHVALFKELRSPAGLLNNIFREALRVYL